MKKLLSYFTTRRFVNELLLGLGSAVALGAFIYLAHFGMTGKALNTLLGLVAFYMLLHIPRRALLFSGFFTGILWFYWISFSFKYNGVGFMAPFIVVGFGFVYMLFFALPALSERPWVRALAFFALSFVAPFDFNWFVLPLPFVESYIGIEKWQFALVLAALSLPSLIPDKRLKALPLLLLLGAIDYTQPQVQSAPLKIKLVQTEVPQEIKWTKEALKPTIEMIYKEIEDAAVAGYDVVVLPESVVPLFLNRSSTLIEQFKLLAENIDIVLGALLLEEGKHFNVAYHFGANEQVEVAKKVVLVPFGEYIPLPSFAKDFINETFFAGASDFITASRPTDFHIRGVAFRAAICYEATTDTIYSNDPKYMIAISNNAWFLPSIEPTLQRLLMRYYAKRHNTVIYHSANGAGSGIVTP